MRVLHAVHAYPPSVGGSEQVVHRLSTGLAERGHQVEVATKAHPDRAKTVDGIPVKGFETTPAGWARYRRWVHDGVEADRWDVVMTYHSKVWTHLALIPFDTIAPRWVYAPTEFTDIGSAHPRHLVYYRTVEPMSLKRARRVMLLTQGDVDRAVALAGQDVSDHLRVVPNGTDVAYWADGEAGDVLDRLGLPDGPPLVLYVGGLWPHKHVEMLVDALADLPEHHLVCAGPTKDRADEITQRAKARGVADRVHLLGPVEDEDLRSLYHACSVHASASDNEGFGLTYLEAMACGKPVVAQPVGVIPELVEQEAVVETATTPEGFAQAIARASETDASANAELVQRYDWETVLDDLEALYEEVAP